MKPRTALTNTLQSGSIVSVLAVMLLTTLCYGQASTEGPPHNVIYSNGYDSNGNDAFPEIASSDYTDVIVSFLTIDTNCQFNSAPSISLSDMQTLHNAGKTVLVSFGGADYVDPSNVDETSEGYQVCSYNEETVANLASNIAAFVTSNRFDGVDIDFEDSSAFQKGGPYDGVQFLTQLTDYLYEDLPQGHNIITHAPQTPYWLDASYYNSYYPYPPYIQIYWNTSWNTQEIAWFNNQTYNNCLGGNPPTDCNAQDKINNYTNIVYSWGLPSIQLVVGVPVTPCGTTTGSPPVCTGDGYIPWVSQDGNNMLTVISQLEQTFPNSFGGVMGWDFILDSNQPNQWGDTWNHEIGFTLSAYEQSWVGWNALTGLVLDSNYNAFNNNVYTDSYNGGNYQNWTFSVNTIYNTQTLLCLDSNYAGAVYTDSCNGGNYQNWQFVGNTIVDRQTRRCLDSDYYGNVSTNPCNGSDSQNWNVPGQHP